MWNDLLNSSSDSVGTDSGPDSDHPRHGTGCGENSAHKFDWRMLTGYALTHAIITLLFSWGHVSLTCGMMVTYLRHPSPPTGTVTRGFERLSITFGAAIEWHCCARTHDMTTKIMVE